MQMILVTEAGKAELREKSLSEVQTKMQDLVGTRRSRAGVVHRLCYAVIRSNWRA